MCDSEKGSLSISSDAGENEGQQRAHTGGSQENVEGIIQIRNLRFEEMWFVYLCDFFLQKISAPQMLNRK